MAEKILRRPLYRRTVRLTPDGQTHVVMKPNRWKLTDILPILRLASDLNRRGLLLPRDGPVPEDSWRETLLELGMDADDPDTWLEFYAKLPEEESQAAGNTLS